MTNRTGFIERRKHKRFKVKGGAFASIQFDHYTIGPIKNISRDGLAFRYISEKEQIPISLEVDIFASGKGFLMNKIPSKRISDFNIISVCPKNTLLESFMGRKI